MKYWYVIILLGFFSCTGDVKEDIPDVSHIEVDYQVVRFEQEMLQSTVGELVEKYPAFANDFFKYVIPVYREKDYEQAYANIKSAPEFKYLIDTMEIVFDDFANINDQFKDAFKFVKYYFPEIDVPDVYTFVSGFAHQQFLFSIDSNQHGIGIGLDMFLGSEFNYGSIAPENPAFSDYLARTFNKDHIVRKSIHSLLDDYIPNPKQLRMIDQMIYNGKNLYLLNKMLPLVSDTIIMEYSKKQWDWAKENEIEMWAFFLKENLFYETNTQKINKYINPSPHSPGMPPSAPGRTANFIGWKIVDAYMRRFPETSVQELVEMENAQELLQKSRYKPRK